MKLCGYPIVVICVLLISQSCLQKSEPKGGKKSSSGNELVKTTFPNGKTKAEIPYKNNKKHGLAKEYYQSGKVFQAIDYANGLKHGFARRYYENGNLYQETPYDSGKIHGTQRKYRENGKITSEMPYEHGNPCVGLKEYLIDGNLKKKYPSIVITPVDNILKENMYTLVISMSEKIKSVEYYEGKLTDGKCLGEDAELICCADRFGVAEMEFPVLPGQFIMKELNIIAKVRTTQGNYYLTQRKYNVAVENRY